MVDKQGTKKNVSNKRRKITFFYINGLLHKKIHINRGTDEITAFCYETHQVVTFSYAAVKRRMEPAFTMSEAASMLNRGRLTLQRAVLNGNIEAPQHAYNPDNPERIMRYMWSEQDIMNMLAFLATQHRGNPRKDGLITPVRLPSPAELRGMIRHKEDLYQKVGDDFVLTYQAPDLGD